MICSFRLEKSFIFDKASAPVIFSGLEEVLVSVFFSSFFIDAVFAGAEGNLPALL
jgi:hypothetical protein